MVKIKDRNSNFELMRIVSMIFIILGHIIMQGNMITNCTNQSIKLILRFLEYIVLVHVNSFVILSGYFQSKSNFRLSKFLALLLQVIFYSTLILIVGEKIGLVKNLTIVDYVESLSLSSVDGYWFIKAYIVVYLLSDIINKFINSLDRKFYKQTLIVLFIIFSISSYLTGDKFFENNGYNFYNFIFLYLIGGYFRRYPIKETYHFKRMSINGYRCFLTLIFFLMVFLNFSFDNFAYSTANFPGVFGEMSSRILHFHLTHASPFIIIQTVCYFLLFETFNIKSKFINIISSCTFGIYLLHSNIYVRANLYRFLLIDNGEFNGYNIFIGVLVALVVIFVSGILIELLRKFIFWLLLKFKVTQKFIDKFKNFTNSFNFKVNW